MKPQTIIKKAFTDYFEQELHHVYGEFVAKNSAVILEIVFAQSHIFYSNGFKFMHYKRINDHLSSAEFLAMNYKYNLFHIRNHKKQVFTRGYRATDKLVDCLNRAIDKQLATHEDIAPAEHDKSLSLISSRRKDGGRSSFKAKVMKCTSVNVQAIKKILNELHIELKLLQQYERNNKSRGAEFMAPILKRIEQATSHRNHALALYQQAIDKDLIAWGFVPLKYQQVGTGRIYATGLSLQNAPKAIRAAALGDCYEYDLENCHYEFLRQKSGLKLPFIEQYCANKTQIRTLLSSRLNLPISTIKTILLSLVYGANAFTYLPKSDKSEASAISNACGNSDKFYQVINDPIIKGIRDEIKQAANVLIQLSTVNGRLSNVMSIYYRGDKAWSKQLAHVLQGFESKALEAIALITASDTKLLLHDGIYTYSKWNAKALSYAIFNATGCKINVSEKCTHAKNNDDNEQATGFEYKGLDSNVASNSYELDRGLVDKYSSCSTNMFNNYINTSICDLECGRNSYIYTENVYLNSTNISNRHFSPD